MTTIDATFIAVTVVFDGGSRGNPGKGYGSFVLQSAALWPDAPPAVQRLTFGNHHTNNEAEYDTLVAALQHLLAELAARHVAPQAIRLTVRGDSDLVLRQLRGDWQVRAPGLQPRWQEARRLLAQFGRVTLRHQPRAQSVKLLGH